MTRMPKSLENTLNSLAEKTGHKPVQAVLNRIGASRQSSGAILPFRAESNLCWAEKDKKQ